MQAEAHNREQAALLEIQRTEFEAQRQALDGQIARLAAVALSMLGASKGGKARAKGMTKKARSEAAKKAAKARWGKSAV